MPRPAAEGGHDVQRRVPHLAPPPARRPPRRRDTAVARGAPRQDRAQGEAAAAGVAQVAGLEVRQVERRPPHRRRTERRLRRRRRDAAVGDGEASDAEVGQVELGLAARREQRREQRREGRERRGADATPRPPRPPLPPDAEDDAGRRPRRAVAPDVVLRGSARHQPAQGRGAHGPVARAQRAVFISRLPGGGARRLLELRAVAVLGLGRADGRPQLADDAHAAHALEHRSLPDQRRRWVRPQTAGAPQPAAAGRFASADGLGGGAPPHLRRGGGAAAVNDGGARVSGGGVQNGGGSVGGRAVAAARATARRYAPRDARARAAALGRTAADAGSASPHCPLG